MIDTVGDSFILLFQHLKSESLLLIAFHLILFSCLLVSANTVSEDFAKKETLVSSNLHMLRRLVSLISTTKGLASK